MLCNSQFYFKFPSAPFPLLITFSLTIKATLDWWTGPGNDPRKIPDGVNGSVLGCSLRSTNRDNVSTSLTSVSISRMTSKVTPTYRFDRDYGQYSVVFFPLSCSIFISNFSTSSLLLLPSPSTFCFPSFSRVDRRREDPTWTSEGSGWEFEYRSQSSLGV